MAFLCACDGGRPVRTERLSRTTALTRRRPARVVGAPPPFGAAAAAAAAAVRSLAVTAAAVALQFSTLLAHSDVSAANAAAQRPPLLFELEGEPRIVDGDTLKLQDRRVRLYGMDAPELAQLCDDGKGAAYPCGRVSKQRLEKLVDGKPIRCQTKDVDRYHRHVCVCFNSRREELNRAMVAEGWAVAYREYSDDYVDAERQARSQHRGVWAGRFETPAEFRRERRDAAKGGERKVPGSVKSSATTSSPPPPAATAAP